MDQAALQDEAQSVKANMKIHEQPVHDSRNVHDSEVSEGEFRSPNSAELFMSNAEGNHSSHNLPATNKSSQEYEQNIQPSHEMKTSREAHSDLKQAIDGELESQIGKVVQENLTTGENFDIDHSQVNAVFNRSEPLAADLVPVDQIDPHEAIDETITSKVVQSLQHDYVLDLPFQPQPHAVMQAYSPANSRSLAISPTQTVQQQYDSQQAQPFTTDNVLVPGNDANFPKPNSGVYFGSPQNNVAADQIDEVCAAVGINQNSNLVDFLSSLELQSRWVCDIPRQSTDVDDRLDHQKALRIASILTDLAFNSDTEDFLPSDADDLWTSDLDDPEVDLNESNSSKVRGSTPQHPGKWRPGQGPVGKKRGKSIPNLTGQQSHGKWKPSGKLDAMRKAKAEKPSFKSRGKRISAKLKAMKKARQPNLSSENEVKWRPGERLRDRRNFRKVWLEEKESMAKRDKKAKPYHAEFKREKQGELSKSTKEISDQAQIKRQMRDAQEDLPPEMREEEGSEEEEEVVPLEFVCRTCNVELSSQGHFIRHVKSQDHMKRSAMRGEPRDAHPRSWQSKPDVCEVKTGEEESYESYKQDIHRNATQTNEKSVQQLGQSARRVEATNSRISSCLNHTAYKRQQNEDQVQEAVASLKKQLESSATEQKTDKLPVVECTICAKTFPSKYRFARHLATNSHLQRASVCPRKMLLDESVQVLLLRQSRVQCLVCSFFGTDKEFLLQHMLTREHIDRANFLIGPLLCVRCKFVCRSNKEMLTHFRGESHDQMVEASGRPCVVKESRTKIPCPSCSAIVQSATRLKVHLKTCTGNPHQKNEKKEPVCTYCGIRFSTLYAMTIHIRRKHTKEKPFRCDWCDVAFADRYSLGVHQLSITHLEHTAIVLPPLSHNNDVQQKSKKGKRYKCRHCPFTAKIYSALRPHYYADHASGQFKRDECNETFSTDEEQKKHNRKSKHKKMINVQSQKFRCQECGKVCKDEKSFKFHELSHNHPLSEKQLAKEQPAGLVAGISNKHLEFIEAIKSVPPIQKVQCPECEKTMPRSRIYAHLRRHEGVKLFQCPYCPKNLASANTLRQHIHAHLKVKSHPCNKCDRSFSSQTLLKEHNNEKHTPAPEALAVCKQCGEKFPSGRLLYKHQLTHISAFKCTFQGCYYTTKYKYDLKVHMKTHSSEKDFLCNLCGFASKRKGGLLEHMKSHTGQRRFTCEYCDYKAKTGAHLRRHMRIHIGAKPFSCPYCSFKCASLDNLHKHIQGTKKHTGLPVYPCKLCDYGTNTSREFKNHLIGVHKTDAGEIGKMLTSYCGIYDKASDPKDIPEGACALPVREVKPKTTAEKDPKTIAECVKVKMKTECGEVDRKANKPIEGSKDNHSYVETIQEQDPIIETIQCDDNLGSSIVLTMLPQTENCEDDSEMQDDAQIFPEIQALLRHLTQQQGGATASGAEPGHDLEIQGQVEITEVTEVMH